MTEDGWCSECKGGTEKGSTLCAKCESLLPKIKTFTKLKQYVYKTNLPAVTKAKMVQSPLGFFVSIEESRSEAIKWVKKLQSSLDNPSYEGPDATQCNFCSINNVRFCEDKDCKGLHLELLGSQEESIDEINPVMRFIEFNFELTEEELK